MFVQLYCLQVEQILGVLKNVFLIFLAPFLIAYHFLQFLRSYLGEQYSQLF